MAKLRFGKRFKRFQKQQQQNVVVFGTNNGIGPNNGGDDTQSVNSEARNGDHDSTGSCSPGSLTIATSDESTTSSLNSDLTRSYGPIDVDTCRKAKNKFLRRSRSKGRDRSCSRERTQLPKIAESPHNSGATTPIPSSQQQKEQIVSADYSPTDSSVLTDDYEQSPGAQTATTINGKDVFERSRSAIEKKEDTLTTINNDNGSSSQSMSNTKPPLNKPPTTATKSSRTESPDATVATASTKSTTSSSKSVHAISPFFSSLSKTFKRDRASTPNSTSADEMLCQSEAELDGPHLVEGSPLAVDNNNNNNNNNNSGSGINDSSRTPTRKNQSPQQKEQQELGPSPVSIIHMFNTTQDDKYAVEIDPIGSQQDGTNNDKTGEGGNERDYSILNHECKDEKYLAQGVVSPPKIHRRPSPTKLFGGSGTNSVTKFWDAMTYTSLEDAILTHHATLIGNNVAAEAAASVSDSSKDGSKAGSKDGSASSSKSSDFLALKKDAEKDEFKKVQAIAGLTNKSKNENKGSGTMVILPPSNKDAHTASNKDVVSPRKGAAEKKTPQGHPQGEKKNWTLGMGWKSSSSNKKDVAMEHPPPSSLMDASTSTTRSASPSTIVITEVTRTIEPASPDPFVNDVLVGTPPPAAAGTAASDYGTAPVASASADNNNFVVESFSFDDNFLSDMGMDQPKLDDSLSDDTSYLSEIESIGEITICEETERLLEAHRMYHDSAKVNMNHPARRKPSIMRVGSVYKSINKAQKAVEVSIVESGSNELSIRTERGSLSSKSNSIQRNATTDKKQKVKLSWYDDEANWNKPFTLRTDETFESSTLTSGNSITTSGMRLSGPLAMNQFFGDFIKGIGCGGEVEDVASFDVGDQQEI